MQPIRLAKRSFAVSSLLHLVAISGLAAWTASADLERPRFAGQNAAIELVVTRAETTWSPEPITLDSEAIDEVRVTVEPTGVRIARKQFDRMPTTEAAFEVMTTEPALQLTPIEIDFARKSQSHKREAITETPLPQPVTLPRQEPQPLEVSLAVVQLPPSLGTDRVAPSFTTSPPPTYPTVAIQNNWEGTVLLRVYIGDDGKVGEVEVARSSGYPVLDGAAVNAVRRWSGSPAMSNGRPISTTELLPVRFKLRS